MSDFGGYDDIRDYIYDTDTEVPIETDYGDVWGDFEFWMDQSYMRGTEFNDFYGYGFDRQYLFEQLAEWYGMSVDEIWAIFNANY